MVQFGLCSAEGGRRGSGPQGISALCDTGSRCGGAPLISLLINFSLAQFAEAWNNLATIYLKKKEKLVHTLLVM